MAKSGKELSTAALTFSYLPITRQVGILVGLAASIALAAWVVLWSQQGNFRPLFSGLDPREAHQVTEALQSSNIPFKFEGETGTIFVENNAFYKARMSLATQGLPNRSAMGYELLQEQQGIGSSQFIERARYRHAMETELSRSIMSFRAVRKARVHLAVPKQSVFVRDKRQTTASVLVDLYPGRDLAEQQAMAIAHLVASSVPGLNVDSVTVVDQEGRVLNEEGSQDHIAIAGKQLKYIKSIEKGYRQQIESILTPLVGVGKIKAQVSVDIDFTQKTLARESFDPDMKVVRSEQSLQETKSSESSAGGVPGSLSNTPGDLQVPNSVSGGASGGDSTIQTTRNYELDKTVSYTEKNSGTIKRITVAVAVDNRAEVNPDTGEKRIIPIEEGELEKLTRLVKGAIGFNVARGDQVNIVNASFFKPEPIEDVPDQEFLERPEIQELIKQGIGALVILVILFGVLKPTLKSLSKNVRYITLQTSDENGRLIMTNANGETMHVSEDGQVVLPSIANGANNQTNSKLSQLKEHDDQMKAVKDLAETDPKRVAQVIKDWMAQD